MPTYQKTSIVPADFDTVWEFYDDVEELELLTPDWMGLRVPRVIGPDGEVEQDSYEVGTEVHIELQPFGLDVLPEIGWVVEITDRQVDDDRAYFVDEQVGEYGPYDTWRHTHQFVALDGETLLHDRVTYRVPSAGDLPVATPLLAGMLWYRHRRTRALLTD